MLNNKIKDKMYRKYFSENHIEIGSAEPKKIVDKHTYIHAYKSN